MLKCLLNVYIFYVNSFYLMSTLKRKNAERIQTNLHPQSTCTGKPINHKTKIKNVVSLRSVFYKYDWLISSLYMLMRSCKSAIRNATQAYAAILQRRKEVVSLDSFILEIVIDGVPVLFFISIYIYIYITREDEGEFSRDKIYCNKIRQSGSRHYGRSQCIIIAR